MKSALEFPDWLRWIVLLPVSMLSAFIVALLISLLFNHGIPLAYIGAVVSGIAYVSVALLVAHLVAPAYKTVVSVILGVFILGDLAATHVMMNTDLIKQSFDPDASEVGFLFQILRAKDFADVPQGGLVKLAGALAGGVLMGIWLFRYSEKLTKQNS